MSDASVYGNSIMVLTLLGLAVVVCWIILPFAVIGTKSLLRQLLHEQKATNELLREILRKD